MGSMPDPDASIGFLVSDVARLLRRDVHEKARGLGLSLVQWRALAHLARTEGINQAALAERLELQAMTIARLVDSLQKLGLVERRADPSDRRAHCLYLTAKAQPYLEHMWRLVDDTYERALAGLSGEARAAMFEALRHIKGNLIGEDGEDIANDEIELTDGRHYQHA